jgi:hypothetical protein
MRTPHAPTALCDTHTHTHTLVATQRLRRPDVLLVERSVARAAQEELLARGISLVHHTKPELLQRLARCMGVKVCCKLRGSGRRVEAVRRFARCLPAGPWHRSAGAGSVAARDHPPAARTHQLPPGGCVC